jgi:phosphopantothenate synthetase
MQGLRRVSAVYLKYLIGSELTDVADGGWKMAVTAMALSKPTGASVWGCWAVYLLVRLLSESTSGLF